MKNILLFIKSYFNKRPGSLSTEEAVKFSVEKYHKTYKLLEKDEKVGSKTRFLVDDEGIRNYFQQI